MSKRRNALDAVDPSHPDHRKPVWDCGDVGRFCGCRAVSVLAWVVEGKLTPAVTEPLPSGRRGGGSCRRR